MAKSLQEQLLKAGLVDAKQVHKTKTEQRKQARMQRKQPGNQAAEEQARSRKAQAEKAERDRRLNQQRDQAAARKAVAAQIRQLIEANGLPQDDNGVPYNFEDRQKIKRIYVSEAMKRDIVGGRLAIVRHDRVYAVVPVETAAKIRERDASRVVVLFDAPENETEADDPYADYKIPDNLVW